MEQRGCVESDYPLRSSRLSSSQPGQAQKQTTTNNTNNDNRQSNPRDKAGRGRRREGGHIRRSSSSAGESAASSSISRFTFHESEYEENSNSGYRSPTRSDTHSLIKRAAKSALLDEVTPTGSTIFSSGDASDDDEPNDENSHPPSLPNMRSLETPSMPAIPDEQDRKRFVGCLAAVLSSMYDYESYELLSKEKRKTNRDNGGDGDTDNDNDVSGFFDFYESDDDDGDYSIEGYESSKQNATDRSRTNNPNRDKINKPGSSVNKNIPVLSSAPTNDTTDNFYSHRCQSFESMGSSTVTSTTGTTPASSATNNRAIPPLPKTKPTFRQQAANAQKMKPSDTTSDPKANLSRQRYLSRRYELYSGLLLSSSELLLLDKSIARAFLPMLSRVLVPQIHKTHTQVTNDDTSTSCNKTYKKQEQKPQHKNEGDTDPSTRPPPEIHLLDNPDELSPFLDSLTPGAGFRCVSLLLLQHLLTNENGYDARIRHAVKKLSILVLQRDANEDPFEHILSSRARNKDRDARPSGAENVQTQRKDLRDYERRKLLQATRTFEALEQNIARRLILLSSPGTKRNSASKKYDGSKRKTDQSANVGFTKEQLVRGVKIGGAGILAGTLFAVTGGLAAPGIAAGVAAFAGAAAGTAAVSALTSAAVVTTIFGVGGGGLAAYKMQRRTQGVTEFEFCRETKGRPDRRGPRNPENGDGNEEKLEAELFSILCISGWLTDPCDYQRPWGLQPTHPRIPDRLEKLERFYSIHSPDHLPKCERILNSWKGEEVELWRVLREKYGSDPDNIFPLDCVHDSNGDVVKRQGALTLDQEEILDKLFVELGYHSVAPEQEKAAQNEHEHQMSPFEKMRNGWKKRSFNRRSGSNMNEKDENSDSIHGPSSSQRILAIQNNPSMSGDSILHKYDSDSSAELEKRKVEEEIPYEPPRHLSTVWDWKTTYGGEMYTVKWESALLTQICDCVMDLAVDVVSGATRQILKQTVLHTLLSAVIWPTYLLNLAHMIDGDWTIAVERADEAGVVLAKTLLYSRAGRRPVTLVGYSFGARIIYSCLKELARYQEEWEHYQELLEESNAATNGQNHHEHRRLTRFKQKMKGMREPASIVEDAILLGLPNHLSLSSWKACRQIVAGRLVNCYSNNDLILSLMFQAKRFSGGSFNNGMFSILKPVCGTCPVEQVGVENIDCSDLIMGHQDYCLEVGKILERIGFGEPIKFVDDSKIKDAVTILSDA